MLQNLALANPSDYINAKKDNKATLAGHQRKDPYIRRITPPGVAQFFTVGTVMLSSLLGGATDRNRQICIRPMWELSRGIAFMGAVFNTNALYLPTFRDGISLSSMFKKGAAC